jgi:hypothetical protein
MYSTAALDVFFLLMYPVKDETRGLRGEIQMIPESAYKSLASKNWEILWKNKL